MSILLNDAELMALRGLPHSAFCLYVAIRQCMDMATGMVGIRSMISWQALRESLYIEPAPGRTESGSPHESTVRRLSVQLEKVGLLKNCSNSTKRQLIFKCIHATHDKSVQKQPDRQPDRPRQAAKPTAARIQEVRQQQPDRQPDTHPSLDSRYKYIPSSSIGIDMENVFTNDDDIHSETQTENHQHNEPLIFPPRTEDWQQERMRSALKDIPRKDAQGILDELAGRIRAGKLERPLGYFNRMLENYLKGDFVGELAAGEQRIRTQREAERAQREAEALKPVYKKDTEGYSAHRSKLVELGILKPQRAEA